MGKHENVFQASLIRTIKNLLPNCMVLKLDPTYIQGIPDLLILCGVTWAALECKRSEDAPHRPNQDHYVEKMNTMSFSAFIYPENTQQVLEDMIRHFERINSGCINPNDFMMSQNELQSLLNSNNYVLAQA